MKHYELRHIVGFEETNLVGNVYYVNHLRWQGRCREMFLSEHAPGVLAEVARGLRLATVRCSCRYDDELTAFDEVVIRMTLLELRQTSLALAFDYFKVEADRERLIARGEQEIAFLHGTGVSAQPVRVPLELCEALQAYAEAGE